MQCKCTTPVAALVLAALTSACQFERDSVSPGYYGELRTGTGAPTPGSTMSASQARPQGTSPGSSGQAGSAASRSPDAAGSSSSPSPQGQTAAAASGEAPVGPPGEAGPADTTADCDLGGRWLSTVHVATDALGVLQFSHTYIYYELEQEADVVTVTRSLVCGDDAVGVGAFAVTVDFSRGWAGTMSRVNYTGRTGTSAKAAGGCSVSLEKWYTVRGATNPHYLDPAIPLPTAEQKASASTPGWEDWDNDGNPGLTGVLSGVVTGKIFVAPRQWTALSGTVPSVDAVFKLAVDWNQEANVMAYDGSPILGSEAARAADRALHFAQFARLGPNQATGDEAAICASIVELAPMLTPEAAGL